MGNPSFQEDPPSISNRQSATVAPYARASIPQLGTRWPIDDDGDADKEDASQVGSNMCVLWTRKTVCTAHVNLSRKIGNTPSPEQNLASFPRLLVPHHIPSVTKSKLFDLTKKMTELCCCHSPVDKHLKRWEMHLSVFFLRENKVKPWGASLENATSSSRYAMFEQGWRRNFLKSSNLQCLARVQNRCRESIQGKEAR